jgi:heme/copper-type cytochrome/quinol oxidase subunit 2
MDKPKTAIASWRTDSTVLYVTIAIGVIAVLVAAGIIGFSFAQGNRNSSNPKPKPASTSENHTKKKAD